jgi:hypothetical protein
MSKYIVPSMRKLSTKVQDVTLVESDFPSFGSPSPKSPVGGDFKQTILNLIAKDQLDADERNRPAERDLQKMTVQQLEKDGWAVLSLYTPGLCERFNTNLIRAYQAS